MKLVYFAWVRERIGVSSEEIETQAQTVHELVAELREKSAGHAGAFQSLDALRVALDQELAEFDATLDNVSEVAFFPPMTGG